MGEEIDKCMFNLNKHHVEIEDKEAKLGELSEENNQLEFEIKNKEVEIEILNKLVLDLSYQLKDFSENLDKVSLVKRFLEK